MRVVCIVAARMESTRLPGKSMLPIAGKPMVEHVLRAAKQIVGVDDVVLTTPNLDADCVLGEVAVRLGVWWYPADHSDLLKVYRRCAGLYTADVIVRVTGDCPLLDPVGSSVVLAYFRKHIELDYVSNVGPETDGLDTEVTSLPALMRADAVATDYLDRHHVTRFIRNNPKLFKCDTVIPSRIPNGEHWSVDTVEDLERVRAVFAQRKAA